MFYYEYKNKLLMSLYDYPELMKISESRASDLCKSNDTLFILNRLDPNKSRKSYAVSDISLAFIKDESIELLSKNKFTTTIDVTELPEYIKAKITTGRASVINTKYPNWDNILDKAMPQKWKVHVVGLGDVGGTLLSGLRLLGGNNISHIGIFDMDHNKLLRWEYEANQIFVDYYNMDFPSVSIISLEEVFDCDMFVFCVTAGVPPLNDKTSDVRIAQLEGNSKIIRKYARLAREKKFSGIFAVVSDPVDLLCKIALDSSNTNETGKKDFMGLAPEQIRGYGLGVMHARACYYSKKDSATQHYINEGRAFGPHGDGLIIADSICNYNEELSKHLTFKAKTANIEVRNTGYKPYIAPAFSSGSLSLLATIAQEWNFSATYIGGIYMGCKNRITKYGTDIERLDFPDGLFHRIKQTYYTLIEDCEKL